MTTSLGPRSLLVLSLAAMLSGCIGGASFADLTVTWKRTHVDGTAAACPAGFETISVYAHNKPSFFSDSGNYTQTFPCAAGTGVMNLQTSGNLDDFGNAEVNGVYDQISVSLTNAGGENVLEQSQNIPEVDLSKGPQTISVTMFDDGGYEVVNWGYRSAVGENLIGCASAGVDSVELRADDGAGHTFVEKFPCAGSPDLEPTSFGTQFAAISGVHFAAEYTGKLVAIRGGADLADGGEFTFKVQPHNGANRDFPLGLAITIPDR